MTKSQLIEAVAASCDLKHTEAVRFVENVFESMSGALAGGEKVQISGFGTFTPKDRVSRKGRDPKTGEAIFIPAFRTAAFTPSQNLKDRMNRK